MKINTIQKTRLFTFIGIISLLAGLAYVYANISFPSLTGYTWGGSFSTRFISISSLTCPAKSFVKGFNWDYKPICVPYNNPNPTLALATTSSFTASPSGWMPGGKFGTYFNNILNYCSGNGVLKWFTSQWQKICVDAQNRTTLTTNPTLVSYGPSNIAFPTKPSGQDTGGTFQTFFSRMFTSTCTSIQGITGFNANGNPTCANIPVDATCGPSNGGSYYSIPTINLCDKWTSSVVSGIGPWNWSCTGIDGGTNANCSASKKVDGWWSLYGSCSVTCGWWTKSRTCTNPTPANGWLSCVGSASQSCNTQPCPVNGWWSAWSSWSGCSASCGWGTQSSTRSCTNPIPANGGANCIWSPSQNQSCNTQACSCSAPYSCGSPGSCYAPTGCDNQCWSSKAYDCAGSCGGTAVDYNAGSAGCGTPPPSACSAPNSCGSPGSCYAPSGCDNQCWSSKAYDCAGSCGGTATDYNAGSAGCGTPPPVLTYTYGTGYTPCIWFLMPCLDGGNGGTGCGGWFNSYSSPSEWVAYDGAGNVTYSPGWWSSFIFLNSCTP